MQTPDFPYSVPVKLHTGALVQDASASVVTSLKTPSIRYQLAVLAESGNPSYKMGLYISNGRSWRYIAPFSMLNMSVYRGYEISVYADLSAPLVPAPSSFVAYRNGVVTDLPGFIEPSDKALYVTVRVVDASLDENGKIPEDQLPESVFGDLRWAGLIPPYSGSYDAARGVDTGTNEQIPTPSKENRGYYWIVTVPGNQWGYELTQGDWLVSTGTEYQWVDAGAQKIASYDTLGIVQIKQGGGIVVSPEGLIEVDPTQLSGVKTVNSQGPDANGNVLVNIGDIPNLQDLLDSKVKQVNAILPVDGVLTLTAIDIGALDVNLRGAANGVASLDADGKVPINQLPAAILGALRYQGVYDAATDTPALPTPDASNVGFYWVVNVAGTQHGLELEVGDWIVSNGTSYDEVDNQNKVSSVNGKTGVVILKVADIEGAVASVNGALPDAAGNVVVPFATETVAGIVKVPADGGLSIAPDGSLTVSADIISTLGFTPVNSLYVALNGDPAKGNGKINNPFTTISDAVAAAVDGTVIVLLGIGTFAESVIISDKKIGIIAQNGAAGNDTLVSIDGYLEISSTKPVSVQALGINWGGTGSAMRITRNGGTSMRHIVVRTSSAAQAVLIDDSAGAWADQNVRIDGLSVNDGKIQIDTGNVSIRMMPEASNSIAEVNGGTVELADVWRLQRIDHTLGGLYLDNVRQLGTSSAAPALNSTAPSGAGNFLSLRNVSTWASASAQSYINKTGTCQYMVDGLTRNITKDVWAGLEVPRKSRFDRDTIVTHTGAEYSGAAGALLSTHLEGIDNALGGRLKTLTSAGGTSLVNNGNAGQLRGLSAGEGISFATASGVITVTNSGVLGLTSAGTGTSLVNNPAGQLKSVVAGAGITITESSGALTFSSTAVGGVTKLNGLTGELAISAAAGMKVTASGQTITLENELTSAGGTSLISDAKGVLKGLNAGAGINISEVGGVLTVSSSGASGGVTSFNGEDGAIVVQAGLGITLEQSGKTFTIGALGGGSGIQAVSSASGEGASLVQDDGTTTAIAVIKKLAAGTGVTLDEGIDAVTINVEDSGGVSSVNDQTGAVQIVAGTDISVTVNGNNDIEVAYTGSAAGTKVDSLNGLTGPVNLTSETDNLTITADADTLKFRVQGFLTSVADASTSEADPVSLVSSDGSGTGIPEIRQLVAGANVRILSENGAVKFDVTGGSGTVKSVNGITPTDLETGNVVLEAGDVGALASEGGPMLGPIDMTNNAIKNLPNPVDDGDPMTLGFFSNGDFIIDNGEI